MQNAAALGLPALILPFARQYPSSQPLHDCCTILLQPCHNAQAFTAAPGDNRSELCQPCKGRCGPLARSWVVGEDLGGLPAGAELRAGAFALCERRLRAPLGVCVPSGVRLSSPMCSTMTLLQHGNDSLLSALVVPCATLRPTASNARDMSFLPVLRGQLCLPHPGAETSLGACRCRGALSSAGSTRATGKRPPSTATRPRRAPAGAAGLGAALTARKTA